MPYHLMFGMPAAHPQLRVYAFRFGITSSSSSVHICCHRRRRQHFVSLGSSMLVQIDLNAITHFRPAGFCTASTHTAAAGALSSPTPAETQQWRQTPGTAQPRAGHVPLHTKADGAHQLDADLLPCLYVDTCDAEKRQAINALLRMLAREPDHASRCPRCWADAAIEGRAAAASRGPTSNKDSSCTAVHKSQRLGDAPCRRCSRRRASTAQSQCFMDSNQALPQHASLTQIDISEGPTTNLATESVPP